MKSIFAKFVSLFSSPETKSLLKSAAARGCKRALKRALVYALFFGIAFLVKNYYLDNPVPTQSAPVSYTDGCAIIGDSLTKSLSGTTTAMVINVVDGDTVDVLINCSKERLRLIGIDTPETVDPDRPVQCFGKEASDELKSEILGKNVDLIGDSSDGVRDKYGRLLAYVFLDGVNINGKMVSGGFAREYTYKSTKYLFQTEFKSAQAAAKSAGLGLWSPTGCAGKR